MHCEPQTVPHHYDCSEPGRFSGVVQPWQLAHGHLLGCSCCTDSHGDVLKKLSTALQPPSEDELALKEARRILKRAIKIANSDGLGVTLKNLMGVGRAAERFFKRFPA